MSAAVTGDAPAKPAEPPPLRSEDLLRGAREVAILHRDETYRLRLTSNDKLILTK
jgi:hemin uptake protein HemP